jgi:hypothetical protein
MKALFLLGCLFLVGCSTIGNGINKLGYQKIDDANAKIEQIETAKDAQIKQVEDAASAAQKDIVDKQLEEMQDAADNLYLADYGFSFYASPARLDYIINNAVKSAGTFLPAPTYTAIVKSNDELKTELDITKTTLADLQNKFIVAQTTANQLKSQISQDQVVIQNTDKEKNDIINTSNIKEKDISNQKDNAVKTLLDKQQNDLINAQNNQKLIKYIIGVLVLSGLIFGALAVYIPICKEGAIIASIACIIGAVLISYIKIWMVVTFLAVCLIIGVIWIVKKLHLSNKVNINLIGAVQQVKTTTPDTYNNMLKPILTDMNSKYVNIAGEIKTAIDPQVESYIDNRLKELNLK